MVEFIPIDLKIHKSLLIELNSEYLDWITNKVQKEYDLDLISILGQSTREYAKNSVENLTSYIAPEGIYYILYLNNKIAGMGALHKLKLNIGEIKRMYIRPKYRGNGYGKKMLQKLLEKGKEFGYSTIQLDTGRFMTAAQHVYRSAGFQEREEYPESEVPLELRHYWIYMKKKF